MLFSSRVQIIEWLWTNKESYPMQSNPIPLLIQENEASQLIYLWEKKENAIHIFTGYVSNQLLIFESATYYQIVHICCFVWLLTTNSYIASLIQNKYFHS